MDRFLKYADIAQIPITVAAYVGAAIAVVHYFPRYNITMPWQVAIVIGIVGLGFTAAIVQIAGFRSLRKTRNVPNDLQAELEDLKTERTTQRKSISELVGQVQTLTTEVRELEARPVRQAPAQVVTLQGIPSEEVIGTPSLTLEQSPAETSAGAEESIEDLSVVFRFDANAVLVLAFPSDREEKNEDALFLLLYGYKHLAKIADVSAIDLHRSLFASGCRRKLSRMEEVFTLPFPPDRTLEVGSFTQQYVTAGLIAKHGLSTKAGGFYALTAKGETMAKEIFAYMLRHA
jgi:hypothetical protein